MTKTGTSAGQDAPRRKLVWVDGCFTSTVAAAYKLETTFDGGAFKTYNREAIALLTDIVRWVYSSWRTGGTPFGKLLWCFIAHTPTRLYVFRENAGGGLGYDAPAYTFKIPLDRTVFGQRIGYADRGQVVDLLAGKFFKNIFRLKLHNYHLNRIISQTK